MAFESYIVADFEINCITSEEARSDCLLLSHVVLPLIFTVTSFLAMPKIKRTKPFPWGILVQSS